MSDREEIEKKIDAKRARRPKGWAQRCERCAFWELDDDQSPISTSPEDWTGRCHRHAPSLSRSFEAEALGLIAYAVEELANIEHEKDFNYADASTETEWHEWVMWPKMSGSDWCGDFMERPKQGDGA